MLDRYTTQEMREIWSEENILNVWLEVEILNVEAWAKSGVIPQADFEKIRKNASFSMERFHELEVETKHDVVAFTRAVSESLGDEKKWIHYGLTSTDVVDTAYGYLLKQVNILLEQKITAFIGILQKQAIAYKDTMMIGRTHGVHAEPTTLGLKFALWYAEMERNMERFALARKQIEVGKISGAVGTFAHTSPEIEEYVCQQLGIDHALISTQTLQRDRHAFYVATLALIATSLEKMATEIRHLQRSEVREVEEFFSQAQKGSSAMPHKRNPIGSENIVGCARLMRGYSVSAYEDVALWHERDISHSAVERVVLPDATMLLDYMLLRFGKILDTLLVYSETMQENMNRTHGLIFSQNVLLALIDKGWSREKAYDILQPLAMKTWESKEHYRTLIENDMAITETLTREEILNCFKPNKLLKEVNTIYQRLGLK